MYTTKNLSKFADFIFKNKTVSMSSGAHQGGSCILENMKPGLDAKKVENHFPVPCGLAPTCQISFFGRCIL
jgi:hypothetical protein